MSKNKRSKKKSEENYETFNENDSTKPRRLEEETITYLLSLESQLSNEELENSEKEILVTNVLDEIKQRIASAISDRRTHLLMENLVFFCSMKQLVDVIERCTQYTVFLASNRHSSHVQQAVISRFCYLIKNEGLGDLDESYVSNTIIEFVKPLLNDIAALSCDLNASHVIRAVICLLAGLPTISERKGKDSKHRHSVSLSEPIDRLLEPKKFYVKKSVSFDVPEEFHDALGTSVTTLVEMNTTELQNMVVDPTSAAVIGLLIRILSNPTIVEGGNMLIDRLVRNILDFSNSSNNLFNIAHERAGSYFLEAVFECVDINYIFELIQQFIIGNIQKYAKDSSANFVLQAFLRRLSYTEVTMESSKLFSTVLNEIISDEVFLSEMLQYKAGVVLWTIEASTKLGQSNLLKENWCDKVNSIILRLLTKENEEFQLTIESKFSNPSDNFPSQVLFAKIIGALIKGLDSCDSSRLTAKAIINLSSEKLLYICTTNQLCLNVLDVLVDTINQSNNNIQLLSLLLNRLLNEITSLAMHYTGQYLLKKIFDYSDMEGKETIAAKLYESKEKVASCKEGRNSLLHMNIDMFGRKPLEWRQLFTRKNKANEILAELGFLSTSQNNTKKQNKQNIVEKSNNNVVKNDDAKEDSDDDVNKSNNSISNDNINKRKRKRKRPIKKIIEIDNSIQDTPRENNQESTKEIKIIAKNSSDKNIDKSNGKVDMHKIKLLKSSKLLSSAVIQKEIENLKHK